MVNPTIQTNLAEVLNKLNQKCERICVCPKKVLNNEMNLQQLQQVKLDFEFSYKVNGKPFDNFCRVRFFQNQTQVILSFP